MVKAAAMLTPADPVVNISSQIELLPWKGMIWQPLELDRSSGRDPALPVAGSDTSNAGDIDVSVDVAFRDAGFEQIPTLGLGVHAGLVSPLLPAGADVAVHRHGASPDPAELD